MRILDWLFGRKHMKSATLLIEYESVPDKGIEKTAFDTITDLLTEYFDEVDVRVIMFANAEILYPSPSEPSLSPLLLNEETGFPDGPSMTALIRYQAMKDKYSLEEYPVENLGYCLMKVGDCSVFATVCLPSAASIFSKNVHK